MATSRRVEDILAEGEGLGLSGGAVDGVPFATESYVDTAVQNATSGAMSSIPLSGYYLSTPTATLSSYVDAQGFLRCSPLWLAEGATLDRIGVEITSAGSATSVVRLGVYGDADGLPGALILDAGTVAGNSIGGKEITISQALSAGRYWLGMVSQGSPSPHPTFRSLGGLLPSGGPFSSLTDVSSRSPYQGGVNGALPATFALTGLTGAVARVMVRVA